MKFFTNNFFNIPSLYFIDSGAVNTKRPRRTHCRFDIDIVRNCAYFTITTFLVTILYTSMCGPLYYRTLIPVLLCCLVVSCGSKNRRTAGLEREGAAQESSAGHDSGSIGTTIPPNHCRIIGVVVEIKDVAASSDVPEQCAQAPCWAIVKIESVLGYGSAFGSPLPQGSEILVHFPFTVMPTRAIFPQIETQFPGLSAGSRFFADLEAQYQPESGNDHSVKYIVYGYEIR